MKMSCDVDLQQVCLWSGFSLPVEFSHRFQCSLENVITKWAALDSSPFL
jgi:hypothetical protein